MTGIPRWGASGRTGLPEQMPNGEWVKYADHLEAMRAIGVHGTPDAHLPECPVEAMLASGRTVAAQSCICEQLRACEQRCDEKRHAEVRAWSELSRDNFDHGFAAGLDAAREAVEATFIGWCKDYMNCTDYEHVCGKRREIITAIDGLREK